ncbi:MAG: hypothetical protein FWH10_08995, partial [Oscillospiraceae bacterium]|nr:hypothetical protein [Oscillospiraceae bacterium]
MFDSFSTAKKEGCRSCKASFIISCSNCGEDYRKNNIRCPICKADLRSSERLDNILKKLESILKSNIDIPLESLSFEREEAKKIYDAVKFPRQYETKLFIIDEYIAKYKEKSLNKAVYTR